MNTNEWIELKRDCRVVEIPSGIERTLPAGSRLRLSQSLGGTYTVTSDHGYMYRVDANDADALGLISTEAPENIESARLSGDQAIWNQLKTIYDPEIPVNIVDLGLIYSCEIISVENESKRIDLKMSLTAPGCGMANVLKSDVERKLRQLPGVNVVNVEVVFDPPWNPGRMSEAARLQLGLDLDGSQDPLVHLSREYP